MVVEVTDKAEKMSITRAVLEALPDWFEVTESREQYIRESAGQIMVAAYDEGRAVFHSVPDVVLRILQLDDLGVELPPQVAVGEVRAVVHVDDVKAVEPLVYRLYSGKP